MVFHSNQKTALITGITGFTGKYLKTALESQGFRVFGISSRPHVDEDIYCCDLQNKDGLLDVVAKVKPDIVAHLAGISFVQHGDINEIYSTNLIGTRNLLEALSLVELQPDLVMLASSANIYGATDLEKIDESTSPNPLNDYAVSKYAMELMAKLWADKLPIIVARPFNYTGVGQSPKFLIPKIVDHYKLRKKSIELGNIDIYRDYSDVRDVVDVYVKLLTSPYSGEVFNVCSGKVVSIKDIIKTLTSITGHELEIRINPEFIRSNDIRIICGSDDKLTKFIGELQRTTLTETLSWMLRGQ